MIKPTIGRVVWYHPTGAPATDQPQAAIVDHVCYDTCVNLAVFSWIGEASFQTSVFLYQGDTDRPSSCYAEWMPYQMGQAAKTEALEADKGRLAMLKAAKVTIG